jgi:hypothetical protein
MVRDTLESGPCNNIAFSILDEDPEEKAAREAVAGAEK